MKKQSYSLVGKKAQTQNQILFLYSLMTHTHHCNQLLLNYFLKQTPNQSFDDCWPQNHSNLILKSINYYVLNLVAHQDKAISSSKLSNLCDIVVAWPHQIKVNITIDSYNIC